MSSPNLSPLDLLRRLRSVGPAGLATAACRRAADKINGRFDFMGPQLPVRAEDLAESSMLGGLEPRQSTAASLQIGWVCAPPGPGSGGHTTLFRMVEAAEQRGHQCTLFLYDRNSDNVDRHERVIRQHWPRIRAEIRSATRGFGELNAVVASSWGTAHVVAKRASRTVNRFYFIQDYEPYFYPRGALYSLAEDTYRFGFVNVALGEMVASTLAHELGVVPDATVPFGCDTTEYKILPRNDSSKARSGIVYYAKRTVDRRGYLLAKMGLEVFHQQHPEQEIHIFGDKVADWKIPVTNHGSLSPSELNELYNRTVASIALSFTNITLIAEELMAAGNVPIMNDHPFSRAVVSAPHAIWVPPTPAAIARGLSDAVTSGNIEGRAKLLAEAARLDWRKPASLVTQEIERVCHAPSPHELPAAAAEGAL